MVDTSAVKQDGARLKIKMRLAEEFVVGVRLLLGVWVTSRRLCLLMNVCEMIVLIYSFILVSCFR